MSDEINLRDRFVGCLLGCAIGDALGAPFEGMWSHSIPGENELLAGFSEFEGYPLGQYTDDTQLSVATIEAILKSGDIDPAVIARSISRLWKNQAVIGPGGACTSAAHRFLKTRDWTTCGAPVGQAGNGTAMRTAVLGLYFIANDEKLPDAVADVSRITHKDARSVAGGIAIAKTALLMARGAHLPPTSFCERIGETLEPYESRFAAAIGGLPRLLNLDDATALHSIAWSGMDKPEFERPIITPFVVPTVLAALWCILKHPDSWSTAVAAAIGLGGDVDTLGAIVGALMGTKLGVSAIPQHLRESVADSERLQVLAARYHAVVLGKNSPERR